MILILHIIMLSVWYLHHQIMFVTGDTANYHLTHSHLPRPTQPTPILREEVRYKYFGCILLVLDMSKCNITLHYITLHDGKE